MILMDFSRIFGFNPNHTGVSEPLIIRGGNGSDVPQVKIGYIGHILHSNHKKKSYQGTQGTPKLPPTGSMTSHGPSIGLTGSPKRTS